MNTGYQLLPVFLVGLAGSVHCVGMCGGIVGAISASGGGKPLPRNVIPTQTAARFAGGPTAAFIPRAAAPVRAIPRVLAYNAGRIGSYMLAGALAGGLANGAQSLADLVGWQLGFYWLANLMLVALGLYLMNAWHGLTKLEQAGRTLWQRAQPWMAPAMKTLIPANRPHQAFALGALWGWLPCGMVYSVLLTAMLTGSALGGAIVMLAFGLGTLPMLTGLGLMGARLRNVMQRRKVRVACGMLVLTFGLLGVARAAVGITPAWMDILCLTPHP
ncbi:sulfite exporter TauE/SafE family protein [Oxalobacteraceae bacterium OTU3CINTB1]|nr:sulfite exporter TauE/SafE family protein [Oxalobacteraceae bacterium OTU3CINTB1]